MSKERVKAQMKKAGAPIQQKSNDKMPGAVKSKMESAIDSDFSDVNIHVGAKAASSK